MEWNVRPARDDARIHVDVYIEDRQCLPNQHHYIA